MTEKILSLGTIRDYIKEYFPDLLWWDGFGKHEIWNKSKTYLHRQGMPNEIRIEFDNKDSDNNWSDVNLTCIELYKLRLSFAIFAVEGGRGPHIHIYDLDELETLNQEERMKYRLLFLKKVCPIGSIPDFELCDEKHLCALEFANHFKYGKPKRLLSYFWQGPNQAIDFDIKWSIIEERWGSKSKKETIRKMGKKFGDMLSSNANKRLIGFLNFESILDKYFIKYRHNMAQCPFHNDTNFSLSFSNDKGVWHCFGCQEKGDMITLIRKLKEVKNATN